MNKKLEEFLNYMLMSEQVLCKEEKRYGQAPRCEKEMAIGRRRRRRRQVCMYVKEKGSSSFHKKAGFSSFILFFPSLFLRRRGWGGEISQNF